MDSEKSHTFRELLQQLAPIPESEWQWLEPQLETRCFEPGMALFSVNRNDRSVHFIRHGLVRYHYLTPDGLERNHGFASEGNLVGCFRSFVGQGECTYSVTALEVTKTVVIPDHCVAELFARHGCWIQLKQCLTEHVALRKEAREQAFLLDSAEARYRHFLEQYAPLATRLPQYHIASFLGITPVALSRIRKRINLG